MKIKYSYSGPVMEFDRLIVSKWTGETVAESEQKAKNNLAYQFKEEYGRAKNSKIRLPGKLREVLKYMD